MTKTFLRACPDYEPRRLRRLVAQLLHDAALDVRGRTVLVKPSFVYPARPPHSLAVSTHPALVVAVARALRDHGARRVVMAEDSLLGPSEVAFAAMGLNGDLRGLAEVLPLKDAERVSVEIADPFVEERFVVPRIWLDADVFVSLPKLKVNLYTDVTLSVKNNFGLLLQDHRLPNHHHAIHRKIADLFRVRPPDFVVADSVVVGEGQGPMAADPVELGVLLAGADPLAVDVVACHLMGFDPAEIEHLRLLHEAGLGPLALDAVDLEDPGLLARSRRALRRPSADLAPFADTVQIACGAEVCCPSGCQGMLRNSLDQWAAAGKLDALRGTAFVLGKPAAVPPGADPRRTIVIGDCAVDHRDAGTFLPGCPVPPLSIVAALARKGRLVPLRARKRDIARGYLAHAWRALRGG